MNKLNKYRNIALAIFFLSIMLALAAFVGIINPVVKAGMPKAAFTWAYVFIVLAMFGIIAQFVLFNKIASRTFFANMYELTKRQQLIDEQHSGKEDDKKETVAAQEETDNDASIEEYKEKLLPKPLGTATKYCEAYLSNLAHEFEIVQGVVYVRLPDSDEFRIKGKYAYIRNEVLESFKLGETIPGQAAKNKKTILLDNIPENYISVLSGLGGSTPKYLLLLPLLVNEEVIGVIELAMFKQLKQSLIVEKVSEQFAQQLNILIKEKKEN
ncbi:MAG: GAF domain-containing protein [Bacteroidales bacterium]|nr:GAF domain-containing protein [Bacteroidales bacterium]